MPISISNSGFVFLVEKLATEIRLRQLKVTDIPALKYVKFYTGILASLKVSIPTNE